MKFRHVAAGFSATLLIFGAHCATPLSVPLATDRGFAGSSGDPLGGAKAPSFDEPVFVSEVSPPPIQGGTLLLTKDGATAVAADPARDVLWIVDLTSKAVRSSIALSRGDEPGRLIEDAAGRVHVTLRGAHAVVTVDPATGALTMRRDACEEPRGIAYDPKRDVLHVACATGVLLTFPAGGGAPVRRVALDGDLRDVLVDGDRLLVSRFRSAEVLVVGSAGLVLERWRMSSFFIDGMEFEPDVAWRLIGMPGGGAIMAHQSAQTTEIQTTSGAYGGAGCTSIVNAHVSAFSPSGLASFVLPRIPGALPVDLALTADRRTVAVAMAGNAIDGRSPNAVNSGSQIFLAPVTFGQGLRTRPDQGLVGCAGPAPAGESIPAGGAVVAIAFDPGGNLIYQTWDPPAVGIIGPQKVDTIMLSGDSRKDTGHLLFHRTMSAGLACASCHPEGGEDGRVWHFEDRGLRRTQSLRFGLLGTEPFHWGGELVDFSALVHDVLEGRMTGPTLASWHIDALAGWIDRLRPWQAPTPDDPDAVERGRALFQQGSTGCSTCHGGAKLTNNVTVDVGTGGAFQIPSLIGVGFRAPYLHNGCAPTLLDRFAPCSGGDRHGITSNLDEAQKKDLVAYLQTL